MLWSLSQKQQGTTKSLKWGGDALHDQIWFIERSFWLQSSLEPPVTHHPTNQVENLQLLWWSWRQPSSDWNLSHVFIDFWLVFIKNSPLPWVGWGWGCCWVDLLRRGGGRGGCEGWIWGSTFCSHVHLYWCPCCQDDVLEFNKPHYSFPRNGRTSMGGEVGPSPSVKREAVHSSSNESFY